LDFNTTLQNNKEDLNLFSLSSLVLLSNDELSLEKTFSPFIQKKETDNNLLAELNKLKQEDMKTYIESYKDFVNKNIEHSILMAKKMELPFDSKEYLHISQRLDNASLALENFDYSKFELFDINSKDGFLALLDKVEVGNLKNYRNPDFFKSPEIFQILNGAENLHRDKVFNEIKPKIIDILKNKLSDFSYMDLIDKIGSKLSKRDTKEPYDVFEMSKDIYNFTTKYQLKSILKLG